MSGRGGIGRRASFRYSYLRVWEFKSPRPHFRGYRYKFIFRLINTYNLNNHLSKSLIIFLGSFFLFLGLVFLIIPLIYLELGRQKDLVFAALNLLIGFFLIIKNKVFENTSIIIFFLISIFIVLLLFEIISFRWNQLTDQEKNKLITISQLSKNLTKIKEAIKLGFSSFKNYLNFFKFNENNKNINKKKWVRNDKNDIIDS